MSSSSFNRLKNIALPTKNLINGYIRLCEKELFADIAEDNPYYNIPQLINNHCMLFYEIFAWFRKYCGAELEFLSDTEVTMGEKEKSRNYVWLTCMFENMISSDICDAFSISFKIQSFGKGLYDDKMRTTPDFYIGYTKGDTLEESIKDWEQQLGENENAETSSSWCFNEGNVSHSGEGDKFKKVKDISYEVGDILKIEFDFMKQEVKVYHNDEEADCRKLLTDKVWVGVSLGYPGETVEMIGYKYQYSKG